MSDEVVCDFVVTSSGSDVVYEDVLASMDDRYSEKHETELTFKWLINKIKEKLKTQNAKKVAVADLEILVDQCGERATMNDLKELISQGYSHLIAVVDIDGKICDVEVIKDTSCSIDDEVDQFINRTHEGIVVIER